MEAEEGGWSWMVRERERDGGVSEREACVNEEVGRRGF